MSLQACTDLSEAISLDASLGLYLKPASKIKISVQLPKLKVPGQSISTWQVMEKLKATVRPDQFIFLKALKITSAVIKFLGELETRPAAERALARLQAAGGIKLVGFSEFLQIRSAHAGATGPTRHDWDSFFRDARGVDEMKPGERPDTVYLQDLPTCWFSESSKNIKPSDRLVQQAFSNFGRIRRIEIPLNKDMSEKTFGKTSSLFKDLTFQVYIQYEEYVEFATAMDSLRGKKLLHKDADGKVYSAEIKVDFDRTNYLSDKNIKKRNLEVQKASSPVVQTKTIDDRIEKSLVKASQIALELQKPKVPEPINYKEIESEATLLLKELLQRAEVSEKEKDARNRENAQRIADLAAAAVEKELELRRKEQKEKNQEKLLQQERLLKKKLLKSLKAKEQQKMAKVREKLRKELGGHKLLSVLGNSNSKKKNAKKVS